MTRALLPTGRRRVERRGEARRGPRAGRLNGETGPGRVSEGNRLMVGEKRGDAVETTHDLNLSTQPDPVLDPDFELLENYLDGELTPAEVQRLEHRLVLEPDLSAALGRMSAEHAVRQAVWQSMEPGEAAARSLAA